MPFFSIIIPAYNAGRFIDRALGSLAAQACQDFETIVVDDGSADDTLMRVRGWQERLPALKILSQANAGPGAARNAGLSRATGRFVLFLDADDELLPEGLSALRAVCEASPEAQLVYASYVTCKPEGKEKLRLASAPPAGRVARFGAYLRRQLTGVGNKHTILRRDALGGLRFPEGIRNNEDLVFYAHALARMEAQVCPKAVARVHHRPDSLRHDLQSAMDGLAKVSDLLFDASCLSPEFLSFRREFESGRLMALGARLASGGLHRQASGCYRRAFRLWPGLWCQGKALRRLLRSLGRGDR